MSVAGLDPAPAGRTIVVDLPLRCGRRRVAPPAPDVAAVEAVAAARQRFQRAVFELACGQGDAGRVRREREAVHRAVDRLLDVNAEALRGIAARACRMARRCAAAMPEGST